MQGLVDVLKSRGKIGAGALVLMGLYIIIEQFMGTEAAQGSMTDGVGWVMAGLSLFGIRAKLG